MIILSHYQASPIIDARGKTSLVKISPDLGLSFVEVRLEQEVYFPNQSPISWDLVKEIIKKKNNCIKIENGKALAIREFSEVFNHVYTLYPTETAPTMLVSGIPMHRIKDTNPWKDTQIKINAFGQIRGHILDTATGLGYTAILAAEDADMVTTIELDPAAQRIAKLNPWSKKLFKHPKISQRIGDSAEIIKTFADRSFSGIVHDPPMFSMAGELYSLSFYREAFRVLTPDGRMFHYIGNPESKTGKSVTRGVVDRLHQAGFSRVVNCPNAFGVMAYKFRKMA